MTKRTKEQQELHETRQLAAMLAAENKRLKRELHHLAGAVHFSFNGERTACGRDVFDAEVTDVIEDITCKICRAKYAHYENRMKQAWERDKKSKKHKIEIIYGKYENVD